MIQFTQSAYWGAEQSEKDGNWGWKGKWKASAYTVVQRIEMGKSTGRLRNRRSIKLELSR